MTKIKRIFRRTIEYIAARRLLSVSIIIVILLFPTGAILTQKYVNNKENNIEKLEEQSSNKKDNNKGTPVGKINTDAVIDKSVSKHTLSEGFSTLPDDYNSSSNDSSTNNVSNNTSSNTSHIIIDKSSLSGLDLEILEGHEFNPKKDLKLKATDKDGSNISDSIIIDRNNVNTTVPGIYNVKASVKLSNGQIKEKEFTVTVKETKLDVSLQAFKPMKINVKKGEKIGFDVDLKVSKKHVEPIAVMINGEEYPLYKGNENIIYRLINTKNYKIFIDANNTSGLYDYNLEHIKMSNGAWISLGENITNVQVLKDEVSIKNFNYQEISKDKMVEFKFDLEDIDNTASNLMLEFYKGDKLLETIKLDKRQNYSIQLPVDSNGIYNVKVLSDINLNSNTTKDNIVFNKEVFVTSMNISNIDQTSITGNNIEITEGQDFDAIRDLDLKATDFDGEDITDKIQIEGDNIDVDIEGEQTISVYVVNKHGKKYTKEFDVTVNPITKSEFSLSRMLFKNFADNKSERSYVRSSSNVTIIVNDTKSSSHTVDIHGIVSKSDGSIPAGKIQVELPTAMSFTVDQSGNFEAGDYFIDNKSSVGISVSVSEFRKSNNGSISVKPIDENISDLDRSNLHLALVGDNNRYVDLGDTTNISKEILTLNPSSVGMIQLLGESGKADGNDVDKNGASSEFTLVFKIKKI